MFLEQAFPRPMWLFPTTFAVQSVILSFGSANATVMANYLIAISGHEGTNWQIKGTALACYSLATLSEFPHHQTLRINPTWRSSSTNNLQHWFSTQSMHTGSPTALES